MTDISSYDRWQIDPANPCRVVVVHEEYDTPDWTVTEHTHELAVYATPEEAAEAVMKFNGHE